MAPAKVLHGTVRLHGLASSPLGAATQVGGACARAAEETARTQATRATALRALRRCCVIMAKSPFCHCPSRLLQAARGDGAREGVGLVPVVAEADQRPVVGEVRRVLVDGRAAEPDGRPRPDKQPEEIVMEIAPEDGGG